MLQVGATGINQPSPGSICNPGSERLAQITQRRITQSMNAELERMCKEAVMVTSGIISRNLPGVNEDTRKISGKLVYGLRFGRRSSWILSRSPSH
jgi:hypothetical protein